MHEDIAPFQILSGNFNGISNQQVCKWRRQLHFWSTLHNSSGEKSKVDQDRKGFLPMPWWQTRQILVKIQEEDTNFVSTTSWVYT